MDEDLAELSVAEVRALLVVALPLPPGSPELHCAWSDWRRRKRQSARRSHYRRRGAAHSPPIIGTHHRPQTHLRL